MLHDIYIYIYKTGIPSKGHITNVCALFIWNGVENHTLIFGWIWKRLKAIFANGMPILAKNANQL